MPETADSANAPRHLIGLLAFALAYAGVAKFSPLVSVTTDPFFTFWLSSGIYWAVLIRTPLRRWSGFILAALVARLVLDALMQGVPLRLMFANFALETLSACAGAFWLRRNWVGAFELDSLKNAALFASVSAVVAFGLAAPLGAALLVPNDGHFADNWLRWGLSEWVGIWFMAPLILAVFSNRSRKERCLLRQRPVEALALFVSLAAMSYGLYFEKLGWLSMNYALMLWLLWAAVRFGVEGVSVATLVTAFLASRSVLAGIGPFVRVDVSIQQAEFRVLLFLGVASLVFQTVAVILEERARALTALGDLNEGLDLLVSVRAEQLREADARYRALCDQTYCGIVEVDREGRFLTVNEHFCAMVGYQPAELVGVLRIHDLIHKDDLAATRQKFQALIGTRSPFVLEKRYVHKDGRVFWGEGYDAPILGADGRLQSVAIMLVNINARKAMELELRQRRITLSLFVEHAPAALAMLDRDLRYLACSRRWLDDYGLNGRDIIGLSHYEVFPEIPPRWKEVHVRALNGEIIREEEDCFHRLGGGAHSLRWEVRPWPEADGSVGGILIFSEDISERKRAEHKANELAAQLTSALGAMTDAVCIFDGEGGITHFNDTFVTFHRFGHRSQCSHQLRDYFELLDVRTLEDEALAPDAWPVPRALKGEEGFQEEYRLVRRDTGESWFASFNFAPIRGNGGEITGAVLTGRDISDRVQRVGALRKLSLAVEQSSSAIIITNLDGRIEFVNEAFVRTSGYAREEVLGRTPKLVASGQTPVETFADMWRTIGQGQVWKGEFINRAKDGSLYADAVSVWPLRQPDGRISHYVAEQTDITRQKQERAELEKYRQGLEILVEERTTLLQATLQNLETSEENARRLMEWLSSIILIADGSGRFVYANPAGLSALGYALEELQALHIADLVADSDHKDLSEHLAAMGRGEHNIRSWTLKHGDGREIPFQLNTQQLPDGRYIAIGYDRSQELAAEMELRLAASVFENAGEGIFITDAHGTIIDVNQAFVALTGYSREEAIGQNPRLLNSGMHEQAFFAAMRRAYREQGQWFGELWNRCKDGRIVRHMMTISAVREAGEIIRLIGFLSDITEKAQADLRLQESEERLRLTTESLGIGLWYLKPLTGNVEGNNRCRRLFGRGGDWKPSFKGILKAIHPKDRGQVARSLLQSAESSRTFSEEFRVVRPNGTIVWLSAMGTAYCNSLGPEIQMMGICMDITGRKSSEMLLKAQHESLESNDRQKDEFIATLSHEIRNPLAAINNAIAVLSRSGSRNPTVQWAENTVSSQLKQLNRLVGDLLDVSRIAQGKFDFKPTRFAAEELMSQAMAISQPVIDRLSHRLHIQSQLDDLYLEGDMARLIQVFDNLLQNAAKYTPHHGEIWVRAAAVDGEFVLSVRDSGVGIEPELLPRIFEPFVQGKPRENQANSGMGIGLALARRLVQLHGGRITATSAGEGQGSEFTVYLPLAGQRATPRPHSTQFGPGPVLETRPLNVLVVDDLPSVAQSFAMLLELMGHHVEIAGSGSEALRRAGERRPDVVFLDLGLPDMSGFKTLGRMRELPGGGEVPVIALTGFGQSDDLRRTAEAGFYGHLVKPADPDEVEALLNSLARNLAAGGEA